MNHYELISNDVFSDEEADHDGNRLWWPGIGVDALLISERLDRRPFPTQCYRHIMAPEWCASFTINNHGGVSPLRITGNVEKAEQDLTYLYLKYL